MSFTGEFHTAGILSWVIDRIFPIKQRKYGKITPRAIQKKAPELYRFKKRRTTIYEEKSSQRNMDKNKAWQFQSRRYSMLIDCRCSMSCHVLYLLLVLVTQKASLPQLFNSTAPAALPHPPPHPAPTPHRYPQNPPASNTRAAPRRARRARCPASSLCRGDRGSALRAGG